MVMPTDKCGGYHWSHGQYVSSCTPENSTFFIILGFTMLILVILLFIIFVIACIRKQRLESRHPPTAPMPSDENEDDCVIDLAGIGQTADGLNGRSLDNVKAVIMAGEEKATFIAHPIPPPSPSSCESLDEEEQPSNVDYLQQSVTPRPGEQPTLGVGQEVS